MEEFIALVVYGLIEALVGNMSDTAFWGIGTFFAPSASMRRQKQIGCLVAILAVVAIFLGAAGLIIFMVH